MERIILYSEQHRKILLDTAKESIAHGVENQMPMPINLNYYDQELRKKQGCFVTLHQQGKLRGCIGTLEAHLPLIADVAKNAFLAAFQDPRFSAITAKDLSEIELDISVLSDAIPMSFVSEEDLIQQLQPGIDGLIMSDGGHRGTFLPTVWDQLTDPREFLNHLKSKAGLPTNYWSDTIKIERYTTELIS